MHTHSPPPDLNPGETYIGFIGQADGNYYDVILLPGDNDDADWDAQMAWAAGQGGDLPDRVEQAMLFKHFKDQFQADWYWSSETHAEDAGYAWYQNFGYDQPTVFRQIE